MSRPEFSFTAASASPDDKSGVAIWRYTVQRRGEDVEVIVRQRFESFEAALGINALMSAAWLDGETAGYARCKGLVLATLKG